MRKTKAELVVTVVASGHYAEEYQNNTVMRNPYAEEYQNNTVSQENFAHAQTAETRRSFLRRERRVRG